MVGNAMRRRVPFRRLSPPTAFNIFRICANCLSSRFTSCTVVPLPRATRRRRLPFMIPGRSRYCAVIESMMATMRVMAPASTSVD